MPKIKTLKAAAKRFKRTGTGKFQRRRAFHSHLLTGKPAKRRRRLRSETVVSRADRATVARMLPYSG